MDLEESRLISNILKQISRILSSLLIWTGKLQWQGMNSKHSYKLEPGEGPYQMR